MIRRLYIHNFRCLDNFELPVAGQSSLLLIGKNGVGKTTIGLALEVLQKIARGTNRVGDLVKPKDLPRGRAGAPMRFEIEAELPHQTIYTYTIAFEFPQGFRELRVLDEKLTANGEPVFTRQFAQVQLERIETASFRMDWHLAALPVVQQKSDDDPIFIFRQWLANTLIIRPIPPIIRGDSDEETLRPNSQMTNLGAWFSGVLASAPSAYTKIDSYLKQVMPDLQDIKNPTIARESRTLIFQFSRGHENISLPFEELSDGEKCFVIFSLVMAMNDTYGPILCFWDDPDNYLAPSEVGLSIMALRRAFKSNGQLIATSHNPEAIRRFSDENTIFLYRNSHLEPTIARRLEEVRAKGELKGDLVDALIRDDVEA
jgi:ABC-type cobalamin/Fe3+-siderophores transport system ATPase subunit